MTLLVHYQFNGNADDDSKQYPAELVNDPKYINSGPLGGGIQLNQTQNQFVKLPIAPLIHNEMSFSFYALLDQKQYNVDIFSCKSYQIRQTQLAFCCDKENLFYINFRERDDHLNEERLLTTNIQFDTWTHIAITFGQSQVFIYVNGEKRTELQCKSSIRDDGGNSEFWIGGTQYSGNYFNGCIEDFRVYQGVLTAEQVIELVEQDDSIYFKNHHNEIQCLKTEIESLKEQICLLQQEHNYVIKQRQEQEGECMLIATVLSQLYEE